MATIQQQNQPFRKPTEKAEYQGVWIAVALLIAGAIVFAAYSTYDADNPAAVYSATEPSAGSVVVNDTNEEGYVPTLTEE